MDIKPRFKSARTVDLGGNFEHHPSERRGSSMLCGDPPLLHSKSGFTTATTNGNGQTHFFLDTQERNVHLTNEQSCKNYRYRNNENLGS